MSSFHRREFLTRGGGAMAASVLVTSVVASGTDAPRPLKVLFFGRTLPEVQKDLGSGLPAHGIAVRGGPEEEGGPAG